MCGAIAIRMDAVSVLDSLTILVESWVWDTLAGTLGSFWDHFSTTFGTLWVERGRDWLLLRPVR